MCNCFADGDIEIEERPQRHPREPRRTRLSFVRPSDRSSPRHSGEVEVYRRPRSTETIVINHPRDETRYQEPAITLEPYPVPPAAPNPPHASAWHGHHHSGSNGSGYSAPHGMYRTGSYHRHSRTPSSYDSHEPIVQIIDASPEPRHPSARLPRHSSRAITTSRKNNRETRYHPDNESDRDSFDERRRHERQRHDDDRDSWTEEIVPVTRRITGHHRNNSHVRRRHDP